MIQKVNVILVCLFLSLGILGCEKTDINPQIPIENINSIESTDQNNFREEEGGGLPIPPLPSPCFNCPT